MDIIKINSELQLKLSPKRYVHSVGVMKIAEQLAEQYGADLDKARLAGLTHDVCKDMSHSELLCAADGYGLQLDPITRNSFKLLHAPVGAEYARRNFDVQDAEVLSAIAFHTTGGADLTLLDKIIYVADFIDETRDFDGVDEMRVLARKSLDEAIIYGLQYVITDLIKFKGQIHPNTILMWNQIIAI